VASRLNGNDGHAAAVVVPDLDRTRAISSLTVGEAQRLIGLLKTLERAA